MAQLGFVVGLGMLDGGHALSGNIGWWAWCPASWLVFQMGQGGFIVKFYTITTKMLVMRD